VVVAVLDGVVQPFEFDVGLGRPLIWAGNVRPTAFGALCAAIEYVRQKLLTWASQSATFDPVEFGASRTMVWPDKMPFRSET